MLVFCMGFMIYCFGHLRSWFPVPLRSNAVAKLAPRFPLIQADIPTGPHDPRADAVRGAIRHAWTGYARMAYGHDDVAPVSGEAVDRYGVTLLDSLDTLWIADLKDEFRHAMKHVKQLNYKVLGDYPVYFFETIIRTVGGLLSTYELSQEPSCLKRAVEMAEILEPAFNTTGVLPGWRVTAQTKQVQFLSMEGSVIVLSEVGSIQLEYQKLSHYSKDPKFVQKADRIVEYLHSRKLTIPGLYPVFMDPMTENFVPSDISFGAYGDSFYEYLIKRYIMTGRQESLYRDMYIESIDSMKKHMIKPIPFHPHLSYVANIDPYGQPSYYHDHLRCFLPGTLAIGAKVLNRPDDMEVAKRLIDGCIHLYRSTATGLAPEGVQFLDKGLYEEIMMNDPQEAKLLRERGFIITAPTSILRPETVESLFIMYRLTGDKKYQDIGWDIFQAFERHSRTRIAYASLNNVDHIFKDRSLNHKDIMESFFLAETLKYLYLLFADPNLISLDEYVFNTEAHPLRIIPGNAESKH
ncbi:hypothetical protein IWQ60_009878 [Tieghemiomyces parasiticus]|uniref:alpha-1,2-Mannosidase n=1 Tax=Tieghemiomyces parasiticus TaxID=78921 RepID=A0A9W7ZS89_9FUNG|nr:hypothetical protein IWQ60_009878 [Tieghemiomyces parasiticus]